jgi:LacI family transcriptional regulator
MNQVKRATIKEVARAAGVSTQTVSRVLNDRPDVAIETRRRVHQVIEDLGYQPSALARSLIQQRTYTIGVVTAGLKYIGPSRTLNGITSKAEELGYTLLLKELRNFQTLEVRPILQTLLAHHVDGIVWALPEIGDNRCWIEERLPDIPVPIVFLTMEARPGFPIVNYDNYMGGRLAVEHLLRQGYRRIGHISGPLDWWEARLRKAAWRDSLAAAGLMPAPEYSFEGNWSSSSGETAFLRLLEQYPDLDSVFVANDQMALSVLQIAARTGRQAPAQLGVVGFDGLAESAYYWPPLTTVAQDQYRLGCKAVEEIVSIIEAERDGIAIAPPGVHLIQPELIIRESSLRRPS